MGGTSEGLHVRGGTCGHVWAPVKVWEACVYWSTERYEWVCKFHAYRNVCVRGCGREGIFVSVDGGGCVPIKGVSVGNGTFAGGECECACAHAPWHPSPLHWNPEVRP